MKYERDKSIFPIHSKLLCTKGVKTKFQTSSIFMSKKQKFVPSPGLLLTVLEKQRTNRRWCILENAVTCNPSTRQTEVGGQWVMSAVSFFILLKILLGGRCQAERHSCPQSTLRNRKKASVRKKKSVKFLSHPFVCWIQIADNSFPDESRTVGNRISVLIKSYIKADQLITCCLMTSLLYISSS